MDDPDAGRPRGAAALAWRAERLCEAGIALRADGRCAGDAGDASPLGPAIAVLGQEAVRTRSPARTLADRRRGERAAAAHLRRGHEPGCLGLGVSVRAVERAIRAWDRCGAVGLVLEAVEEAAAEVERAVAAGARAWEPGFAREALAHALRRRITPADAPETSRGRGDRTRPPRPRDRHRQPGVRCRGYRRSRPPPAAA